MNIDDFGVKYDLIDSLKFVVVKNQKIIAFVQSSQNHMKEQKLRKVRVWFWLINVTFNSIYVISLRSFLLLFFFFCCCGKTEVVR